MRTGQLDTLIELYAPTETKRTGGQLLKSYAKTVDLFANIDYKTGAEGFESDQKVSVTNITVTIYDRVATINDQYLIKLSNVFYEIRNIIPDKTRFYLEMVCSKRDNQNIGQ